MLPKNSCTKPLVLKSGIFRFYAPLCALSKWKRAVVGSTLELPEQLIRLKQAKLPGLGIAIKRTPFLYYTTKNELSAIFFTKIPQVKLHYLLV